MKKTILLVLCFLTLLAPCRAYGVEVSATAAILLDADSGRVLYEKNADRQMLIASTTKIMTVLVALEHANLNAEVTIKESHMVEGSSMDLKPGEKVSVEELLYGVMLCSGNDAALALADYCGNGVEQFVKWMNEKAAELGMEDSSFANPNGLDDEKHYSTARDMACLAAYAAKNETFVRLCSTESVTIGGRTMTNHNKLLHMVDGCIGMKTGYTKAAGRTLVTSAIQDGRCLVAVTLQDGNDWVDHEALYEYGFAQSGPDSSEEQTQKRK
ncbi:MAG: D-alanyl-D-alanine carboxypeptidase [Clostridiales bacterium]|nr:D-alanyl-D-alanine carboxypeptidase [Candidatus Cacconaster stercorequi]